MAHYGCTTKEVQQSQAVSGIIKEPYKWHLLQSRMLSDDIHKIVLQK